VLSDHPHSHILPSGRVVGLGATSVDTVLLVPELPAASGPSSKVRISRQTTRCGGQTATALATCARFGVPTAFIGAIGDDANGRRVAGDLTALGIDITRAVTRNAPNQFAVIVVGDHGGQRCVLWDRDERLQLQEGELALDVLEAAALLHVDDVDQDAAIAAAGFARRRGIPVTSDLDRLTDRTEALVAAVTVPIFAEHLTLQLTGEADQERALRRLRRSHDGPLVVTLGERGAMCLEGDRLHQIPGFAVAATDTTGAGDVFRGGFIYGLLVGWPMDRILRFANAAAALSCTRLGALDGVPSLDETLALLGERRT
jgi:sugar/nucleoside kinase (ribokinase family)